MTSTTFAQLLKDSTKGANTQGQRTSVSAPHERATKDAFRQIRANFRHEPRRKRSNLRKDHLEVLASDA
jgi:phage terminase large subunit-like protein